MENRTAIVIKTTILERLRANPFIDGINVEIKNYKPYKQKLILNYCQKEGLRTETYGAKIRIIF